MDAPSIKELLDWTSLEKLTCISKASRKILWKLYINVNQSNQNHQTGKLKCMEMFHYTAIMYIFLFIFQTVVLLLYVPLMGCYKRMTIKLW